MKIVPYAPQYKEDFVEMNRAWISELFVLEPEDKRELGNIEPYIAKGGQIFSPWMMEAWQWPAA